MKNLTAFLMMLCLAVFLVGCAEDTTSPSVPSPVGGDDEAAATKAADDAAAKKKADDEAAAKKAADDAAAKKKG